MTSSHPLTDRLPPQRLAVDVVAAVLVGVAAFAFSCWLVEPGPKALTFGWQWEEMSKDPFALFGQFPHRILVPFLAWLFGQGGEGYLRFVQTLHVLMLASTFFVCRRFRGSMLDGVLVTLAIAVTAPVQMYKQHWVGYADPMCYTLFLLMLVTARNPFVFWPLFLANLFNHELAAFLLPWLWFLRRQQDGRWRLDGICVGAALGIYAGYYFLIKGSVEQTYSVDYFLANPLFPGGTFAVWNLAAVHWVCAFGPVLAVLGWHQHTRANGSERWHLWLVLLSILTIFCIAFDWARHSNLLLLPLVIAATRFMRTGTPARIAFAALLGLTVLLLWWVPPWSPTAWPTSLLADLHLLLDTKVVLIKGTEPDLQFGFGGLDASVGNWLPRIWQPLSIVLLIGVAIWLAGWAWARFRTQPETQAS